MRHDCYDLYGHCVCPVAVKLSPTVDPATKARRRAANKRARAARRTDRSGR